MKKILFLMFLVPLCTSIYAQGSTTPITFNFLAEDSSSIPDLPVTLEHLSTGTRTQAIASKKGSVTISLTPGNYSVILGSQFYLFPGQEKSQVITVYTTPAVYTYHLLQNAIVQPITVVSAYKATAQAPVTASSMNAAAIAKVNDGRDLPAILNSMPGVISYSDGGLGFGYSQLRLRGVDQFRINMTVNGVPINDAESNGFYTNNFSDLLASAGEVQLQRGIGLSTFGSASSGGALSIVTKAPARIPSATFINSIGSFNSRRHVAEFNTGLLNNKAAFYGRISHIYSDGFRDNATVNNMSYTVSAVIPNKKGNLRFNFWGGNSRSGLAYYGVSQSILDTNRKFNPLSPQEQDQFNQHFMQAQYERRLNDHNEIAASVYYVKGAAPKFDAIFPSSFAWNNMPDAVIGGDTFTGANFMHRYRLDQDMYGGYVNHIFRKGKVKLTSGVSAFQFISDHFMEIAWADVWPQNTTVGHLAYYNTGTKTEASAFSRFEYNLSRKFTVLADVQYRLALWSYNFRKMDIWQDNAVPDMQWHFVNPKIGARYNFNNRNQVYFFAGMMGREPSRTDYFKDDKANTPVRQEDIKPEQLVNLELGYKYQMQMARVVVNAFYMQYANQIAPTGALNPFGGPINSNIGNSSRYGLELEAEYIINNKISLKNASALCVAKIESITLPVDVTDSFGNTTTEQIAFNNTPAALTPNIIINQGIEYTPVNALNLSMNFRYVSSMYADNTGADTVKIAGWYNIDLGIQFRLNNIFRKIRSGNHTVSFNWYNVTNSLYNLHGTSGYYSANRVAGGRLVYTSPVALFPAATSSFLVTYKVTF